MTAIKQDTVASVHYTGTFPDSGEEFDSSHGSEPLGYLVGATPPNMIPGFEREMMGAKVGEKREFTLMAEDAYGEQTDEAMMDVPASEFAELPEDMELELGMTLMSGHGPFRVVGITDTLIKCDFNHPLSGRALKFEVEVVDVRDASEEELEHGHVHGEGGHQH